MGYACPVCATPQADDEHLANHLAFTALLGDEDHEAWLDEHVPGWAEVGPEELAPEVAARAEPTEYDAVFEDTTDDLRATGGDHAHAHDHEEGNGHGGGESFEDRMARELGGDDDSDADADADDPHRDSRRRGEPRPPSDADSLANRAGADDLDDEAREILEEAHEMTREMYAEDADEEEGESE